MFALFKKLMPREDKFFDLFEAHAAKAVEAAKSLRAVLDGGKGVASACATLMEHEEGADGITEEVMQAIRRSFITPFDRGDIQKLITAMDDAVDQMNKTAKAVLLFEISSFEPQMQAMADGAVKLAGLSAEAMPLLRNIGANAARLHTLTADMVAVEDETDRQNEDGLKALLKGKAKQDAMAYITGAELYEHLEKVADRFEDVAHVISGIAIEHG
jgi:uncharacterized protein